MGNQYFDQLNAIYINVEDIILEDDPPVVQLRSAQDIINSGKNFIVRPANQFYRNQVFVDYWNRYASSRNLWVKFEGEENTNTAFSYNSVIIIVR